MSLARQPPEATGVEHLVCKEEVDAEAGCRHALALADGCTGKAPVAGVSLAAGKGRALVGFHVRAKPRPWEGGGHGGEVVLEPGRVDDHSRCRHLPEQHRAKLEAVASLDNYEREGQVPVDRSLIGTAMGAHRVVIERGPVAVFADAVKDTDPIYRDAAKAREAGFDSIPVTPTFPFAMTHWGAFPEIQPSRPQADGASAVGSLLGSLMAKGGLLLHGEQEFEYFTPVGVGDVLVGESRVSDIYEKVSGGHTMTFVVTETLWSHEATSEPALVARSNTLVRTRNEPGNE